ncbi:hypothetical protein [Vibrio coralliilyticus]|uniref:hypothetical protein n=1 Tax=Vibrio coralliilyticus TaxID=190893 RepID=UPI00156189D1|nr:hypothetical protein [Vibrio coralliilyticus]NRF28397.1 hypothetical protein [Vibrio coralliilyticus]NRF51792.1 hypothetical protein [Vibrio coralliilyticus]NRG05099.1 hypothetical protein [Vibrio coralliilyticus]
MKFNLVIALCSIFISFSSFASISSTNPLNDESGRSISRVIVSQSGWVTVKFANPLVSIGGGVADCVASWNKDSLSFSTKTQEGSAILSLVLAAQVSGKKVYAQGTGTCQVTGNSESWNFGWIVN